MNVEYDPAAEHEFGQAVSYYATILPTLADRLIGEVEAVVLRIREHPQAWPPVQGVTGCRRCILGRFPFQIVYRVEGQSIRIYAFAHLSRRPGYWRERTRE